MRGKHIADIDPGWSESGGKTGAPHDTGIVQVESNPELNAIDEEPEGLGSGHESLWNTQVAGASENVVAEQRIAGVPTVPSSGGSARFRYAAANRSWVPSRGETDEVRRCLLNMKVADIQNPS